MFKIAWLYLCFIHPQLPEPNCMMMTFDEPRIYTSAEACRQGVDAELERAAGFAREYDAAITPTHGAGKCTPVQGT